MSVNNITGYDARFEWNRDVKKEMYIRTTSMTETSIYKLDSLKCNCLVNNGSNITATATSIAFDTFTGQIADNGIIIIDDEHIRYAGITWSSAVAGTFINCMRGFNGTTAATHLNNAPIHYISGTALLNDADDISDSDTSIVFDNLITDKELPNSGIITIGDEDIYYSSITYSNTLYTTGTFTDCVRGMNGTTAAAHSNNAMIYFGVNVPYRTGIKIYNNLGVSMYIGYTSDITNAGKKSTLLTDTSNVELNVSPAVEVFAIAASSNSGTVNFYEYR